MRAWSLIVLAGCGRVGFDALATSSPPGDAPRIADTAPDGATIPPGAKIWLRMETDPGQIIIDSAGGHTSTCVNASCPSHVATGKHGGGYQFMAEEIDVTDAADLDSSAGFTGAIWIRFEALPAGNVCPWSKPFNNANGWDTFALCVTTTGQILYDCEDPSGVTASENSVALPTGGWHHIAMSWDGTTKRDYLDGALVASVPTGIGAGTQPMALGGARNAFYFTGVLDDALYYTRALTPAEIQQLAAP